MKTIIEPMIAITSDGDHSNDNNNNDTNSDDINDGKDISNNNIRQ